MANDAMEVAGAVAMSSVRELKTVDDPERGELVTGLWDNFDHLEKITELIPREISDLLGCDSPEPRLWMKAQLPTLRRSHEIVSFLLRQVNPVEFPLPNRETGRVALLMSVETLARCRGYVGIAEHVMVEPGAESGDSPLALLHQDRMGRARRLVISRIGLLASDLSMSREQWRPSEGLDQAAADALAELQATAYGSQRAR